MNTGVKGVAATQPDFMVAIKAPEVRQNRRRRALLLTASAAVLSALLGVVAFQSYNTREGVLVVNSDLERGHVLTTQDVKIVEMSGTSSINAFNDLADVVGMIATTALVEGDVISPSTISEAADLDSDESVTGLVVGPGQYPTQDLKPGDVVDILAAGSPDNGGGRRLASSVRIYGVLAPENIDSQSDLLVSVVLNDSEAAEVAAQVEQPGGVRLTLRGGQ